MHDPCYISTILLTSLIPCRFPLVNLDDVPAEEADGKILTPNTLHGTGASDLVHPHIRAHPLLRS